MYLYILRPRQATSHPQNNWMISKIFHVSPLVTTKSRPKGALGHRG